MIAWKPVKGIGWEQARDCKHTAEAELEAEDACTPGRIQKIGCLHASRGWKRITGCLHTDIRD
jgi:hypothetical protein